jgi:hypothetical protein
MKNITKILNLAAILLLVVGSVSCQKENTDSINFYEITIGSENPVINYVNNGIEFNFYLLNEQGKPSTVFNEDEKFSFYFKIKNINNDGLQVFKGFLDYLVWDGFSQVISNNNDTIGYPLTSSNCTDEFRLYPFYGEYNTCELIVPWNDNYENWDFRFLCYNNFPQENLPAGKYYTEFSHTFVFYTKEYTHDNQKVIRIPISFKINFEINNLL